MTESTVEQRANGKAEGVACLAKAKTKAVEIPVKSEFLEKRIIAKYGANWLPEGQRVLSSQQGITVTHIGVR